MPATRISSSGVSGSLLAHAMPPKMKRVMPATGMPLAARHERVRQLVGQQRSEEEQGARRSHGEVDAAREFRELAGEDRDGQRPEDQEEDDEPGEVDTDLESEDRPDPNPSHGVRAPSVLWSHMR